MGALGELYLGGPGLARGYLGRPALTAERFVPDPFGDGLGGRLYRTGDLARWRPDGLLELIGRADRQVKIRGFRIELGEVEAAFLSLPAVREVAVTCWDADGEKELAAYVVLREAGAFDFEALRRALQDRLPRPMIPRRILEIDALPISPNGKVDRSRFHRGPTSRRGRSRDAAEEGRCARRDSSRMCSASGPSACGTTSSTWGAIPSSRSA